MNNGQERWRAVLAILREQVLELDSLNRGACLSSDSSLNRDVDIALRALSPTISESMPMWSQRFNSMDLGDRLLFVTDNVDALTDHSYRIAVDMIRCSLYPSMVRRAHEKDLSTRMVDVVSYGQVMLDAVGSLWARIDSDGTLSCIARNLSISAGYLLLEDVYREISTIFKDEIGKQASIVLKEADLQPPSGLDRFERSPEVELSSLYWTCHLLVRAVNDFYGPEFVDHLYRYSE